jgi:UDPglucose 6-dehydrogenase
MKITMIGSGYVGLVTGACFAEWGHEVICVDRDTRKIADLRLGRMPIYEPGLDTLISHNVACGRLTFSTVTTNAVAGADAIFIAVGTPPKHGNGEADLSHVYAAAQEVAQSARSGAIIVTKSTVPVGSGDIIERIVRVARPQTDVSVVSNPEFLREGSAIADFQQPDRVVIGTDDERARDVMMQIYEPLCGTSVTIVTTERRTAELIKYAANAFLAAKVTYINEIADLCEHVGAQIDDVARGVGLDSRIGTQFFNAGPGYGGSCFPKDTLALLRTAQDYGVNLRLVENAIAVNEARKRRMARKVIDAVGGTAEGRIIAVLGLAFKPNTDDMREAPSLPLIEALQRAGAHIRAYDPEAMAQAKLLLEDVVFTSNPYECAAGADAVVLVTDWDYLKSLNLEQLHSVMRSPIFIDLRNAYPQEVLEHHGFAVFGVGRPTRLPILSRQIHQMPSVDSAPSSTRFVAPEQPAEAPLASSVPASLPAQLRATSPLLGLTNHA